METYDFSAKEPSLGYFYQIKYALYTLLESNLHNPKIRIECLDDLEIIDESSSKLIQTKFHKKESTLTDRNKDFWKTIRIWSEYIKDQVIDISETEVVLVTTSNISDGSIMSNINSNTEIDKIITNLDLIANEKNKANQKGYDSYKALSTDQKKELISKMYIIDNSFDFDSLELKIQEKIKLSTLPSKINQLSERLYGWWLEESIKLLLEKKESISLSELQEKIWFINDQMKSDNLPVDYDEKFEIDDKTLSEGNKLNYIKQLDLISTSDNIKT